ncbi:AbrB/MazE/SpoVT family DNA-binding domain-containing protein [uncultured Microbulbifer sp.]|uniref:AbrB/MazE/SpoVT family DNA-binding domain-containing protein n=1 Tax=uncultured Microbulbifer sp. TaxID=348147 RepID=UPI00260D4C80|nr:AbrB/MazE/SpoVT family DNA-binding domain-containing protein [uncultured Microbulbifer sp.]
MAVATLSSKFQFGIPKSVREELGLQAGQKFTVISKGGVIGLVPLRSLVELTGMMRGARIDGFR